LEDWESKVHASVTAHDLADRKSRLEARESMVTYLKLKPLTQLSRSPTWMGVD